MKKHVVVFERKHRTQTKLPSHPLRAFSLTDRDVAIIEAVHRYRMLERRQIEGLLFSPSGRRTNTSRTRKRLRQLYLAGYLKRVSRLVYPSTQGDWPVYRLGPKGARLLAEQKGIELDSFYYWGKGDDKGQRQTQVSTLFLAHGITLADVKIAIEQAAARMGLTIEKWQDEMELRRAYGPITTVLQTAKHEKITIIPDGYFVLLAPKGRGYFFLEVDRSSESVTHVWRRKILAYKESILRGDFHRLHRVEAKRTAPRILTTTLSIERAENLKVAAEQYGPSQLSRLFWFAPLSVVLSSDPLSSPIWLRAGETTRQAIL